nr:hypothetical protein [Tanacetum cinerariifolium]
MTNFLNWYCRQVNKTKLTQADLERQAYEVVKAFYPDVIHLQFQIVDVHRPLPLGGPPGHVTIQSQFFFNKYLEYLRHGSKGNSPALSISKIKAASYYDFGLELLVLEQMWIEDVCTYHISAKHDISHWWFNRQKFYSDRHDCPSRRKEVRSYMRILSIVRIKAYSRYGYDYLSEIVLRRADLQEHIIAEKDFWNLHPSNFDDMNLLLLQGHLDHLPGSDKRMLSTAVKLWTQNLVIRQRVEDFQLGTESYQTQLNFTKQGWEATGYEFKHDYTIIESPQAVLFPVNNNKRKIMRFNEIYMFNDAGSESHPPMLNKENYNYLQQPMPNPEDITDPTTAMNMALSLMAKAFKLNYKDSRSSCTYGKLQQSLCFFSTSSRCITIQSELLTTTNDKSEDITDPTTAMNMALSLMAKAFKLNYSILTNNNQRISSNPCNRQIAQPGMNMSQDRQMQLVGGNGRNQFRQYAGQNAGHLNGYNAVQNVRNQNQIGNGNLVAVRAEGNAAGHNGNKIRCYNYRGQASSSGTQTDKAPVYDSNGSAEVHEYENYYNHEIFNMFTQEEQYTELLKPILEPQQVPQNDNNVISEVTDVEQGEETVEQHPVNFEETRALYDSLY